MTAHVPARPKPVLRTAKHDHGRIVEPAAAVDADQPARRASPGAGPAHQLHAIGLDPLEPAADRVRRGLTVRDPQRGPSRTGLPDRLKAGVEALSGLSLDDVTVHYGSPAPAKLEALAYTMGTHIHVGPGQ
ncbi:MAG: DUF4157 domain-containing protein, partial [Xanthobacteraceae bacterium]